MCNARRLLITISLLGSCLFIFSSQGAAQRDGRIRPSGAVFDPCLLPNPPGNCAPAPTPTPRDPRKGVVLGPASVLRAEAVGGDQDLRGPAPATGLPSNINILNDTATGYVRLWVDWAALQPYPSFGNFIRVDPNTKPLIESLDAQIVEARRNGLKVILTVNHRYPTWAVWYRGNTPPSGSCDEKRNEEICRRVPRGLDESSPWGGFISFLVAEYGFTKEKGNPSHPAFNRYVDFLEVVNEPNLLLRTPEKRTRGGRLVIALDVAEMFETAQAVVRRQNAALRAAGTLDAGATTLKLAGPAAADTLKDGEGPNYQKFTEELLAALGRRNFVAGGGFVWSHHAYKDMEEQRNCAPGDRGCTRTPHCPDYDSDERKRKALSKINSVAWVEKTLDEGVGGYRWRGMRDPNGDPAVFITEGGVRLDQVVNIYWCHLGLPKPVRFDPGNPEYLAFAQAVGEKMDDIRNWQAGLVENSFNLLTRPPLGRGVLLFTNYLTYTDPRYDTGMFDFAGTCADWGSRAPGTICTGEGGAARPLYWKWKLLRTP